MYSVPNTFTPNTVISSSQVNENYSDAGQALTDSLDRLGRGGMLANLAMGNFRIVNLADPAAAQDAATRAWASNASNLDTGTIPDARLSDNVARRDATNTFTAANTFNAVGTAVTVTNNIQVGTLNGIAPTDIARLSQNNIFTGGIQQILAAASSLIVSSSGANDAYVRYDADAAVRAYIGAAGAPNGLVAGSATGDMVLRSEGASILLSCDSGASTNAAFSSSQISLTVGTAINFNVNGALRWQIDANGAFVAGSGARILNNVGSATSPSYSFPADDNTGMYWAATDTVGIGAAGNAIGTFSNTAVTFTRQLALSINSANSAVAGGATALPANPVGYMAITLNGTQRRIAYYAD